MASNAQSFSLDIAKFIEKAKAAPEQVVRKVGLSIGSRLVDMSPVADPDTWKNPDPTYVGGRFRANWNLSFGVIDTSTTKSVDKAGAATKERMRVMLNGWPVGAEIFFTNSLPYAIPLEYGYSNQAPLGMVRITVAEFQTFVNAAVAELPK